MSNNPKVSPNFNPREFAVLYTKKIRIEFLKMYEDIARKINLDDFVRVLPSGKSQIKEVSIGDLEIEKFTDTELD